MPPALGGAPLLLEADVDGDGTYEATVGDTVPPAPPCASGRPAPAAGVVDVRANGVDLVVGAALAPGGEVRFRAPADRPTGWVRATLSLPDATAERALACEPVLGGFTTYCRAPLAVVAPDVADVPRLRPSVRPMVIRAARPSDYRKLSDIERQAGELFREVGLPEIADHEPFDADELAVGGGRCSSPPPTGRTTSRSATPWSSSSTATPTSSSSRCSPTTAARASAPQLLDAVAGWAEGQGHAEVTLTTFRDVPFNAPLYAKRGYEVVPEAEWTDALRDLVAHEADPRPRPRRTAS